MSNYPDGMSMDTFDRATGGGKYEPDMQIKDDIDPGSVFAMADTALDILERGDVENTKDVLRKLMEYCQYDANPNNN